MSSEFGLVSSCNKATFFDYDRDGDLDMYLLNHAIILLEVMEHLKKN